MRSAFPFLRLVLALGAALLGALLLPDQGATSGLSLFPPAAAILVAVATGRLILGLGLAIVGGAFISLPADVPFYAIPFRG